MKLHELKQLPLNGTYVAVLPSDSTKALLEQWAVENGFPLVDDLHATILYSRVPVQVELSKDEHIAKIKKFAIYGESLVIELDCPSLVNRHQQFINLGGTHDYPQYDPHITVVKKTTIKPDDFPIPEFGIVLGNEYTKPLKDD